MALEVKTESEVSPALAKAYQRAQGALEKQNYAYASEILRGILLVAPGFEEARLTLRQAQLERIAFKSNIFRQTLALCAASWAVFVKGPMALNKKDYAKALDIAEGALAKDPTVTTTLQFLRRVAERAGLLGIAVNALEIGVRFHPKNQALVRDLAMLYQQVNEATKSVQMLQKLHALQPNNLQIENELKHAAALAAMQEAKWEKADSYRDLIRDKDEVETLEQAERVTVRDPEGRAKLIAAALKSIKTEPSAGLYRRLAELCHQDCRYQEAIDAYNMVTEVTGNLDPGIDGAITDVMRDRFAAQVKELKTAIEQDGDDTGARQQLEELEAERDRVLLERMKRRVENYPNELQFRFDLGMMYWTQKMVDEAMREFQQAQRSAHLGKRAQLYMGRCLAAKNLLDLAVEQYQAALADKERLTGTERKDGLYDLATVYEQKGDHDGALVALKELFSIDVNYRDVGERLESYYGEGKNAEPS